MKNKTDGTSDVCPSDVEELAKQWTELFNTEVLQYAKPNEASDGEVFANIYHSLAHSPLAATMIQLEHSHASALTSTDELESTSNSEDDWERVCRVSNASHVREIQRREYRQWIETVHEDSSSDATNKDIDGMKHHSKEIHKCLCWENYFKRSLRQKISQNPFCQLLLSGLQKIHKF